MSHENLNFRAAEISIPEIFDAVFEPIGKSGWKSNVVLLICGLLIAGAAIAFGGQLYYGIGKTGLHIPVYWGGYIITFVSGLVLLTLGP